MPGPLVSLLNPWCPLHFERVPGGEVQEPKYDEEANNPLLGPMSPYMMVSQGIDIAGFFASPLEFKAFKLATEALTATAPGQRIQLAEEALRLSPHCAEAYNVLAIYKAQNFEEALEYYKKGAELGPRAFEQERWEEQVEKKDLHDIIPYRWGCLGRAAALAATCNEPLGGAACGCLQQRRAAAFMHG
jgi:tetratricopeptide (TPR) repeat protein